MADTHTHAHAHEPHAAPMWILNGVFLGLLILTVVTVFTATQIDLGPYNLLLAMVIAVLKAALVALFFMHLWWDNLFNAIALIAGLAFLALFIGFSIMDTYQYEPTVLPLNQVLTVDKIKTTAVHAEASPAGPGVTQPPVPDIEEHRPQPAPRPGERIAPATEGETPAIRPQ
jgi:cytochrome c oxidase subunit IV